MDNMVVLYALRPGRRRITNATAISLQAVASPREAKNAIFHGITQNEFWWLDNSKKDHYDNKTWPIL